MSMITGAHSIIYSTNPTADRAFLRDVLGLPHVDAGEGWLIFGLPPAEVAVHPADGSDVHELYFICDSIEVFVTELGRRGVACTPIQNRDWGRLTQISLPGGGKLGVYEPHHPRPKPLSPRRRPTGRGKRTGRPSSRKGRPSARSALPPL